MVTEFFRHCTKDTFFSHSAVRVIKHHFHIGAGATLIKDTLGHVVFLFYGDANQRNVKKFRFDMDCDVTNPILNLHCLI